MKTCDFTLIFCPRWGTRRPWTAPAYLLEAIRSHGIEAQYLDYNIRLFWENFTPDIWDSNSQHQFWYVSDLDYFVDQIDLREIKGKVVGFSLTETNIRFSVMLARKIRKEMPEKLILFGGHRVFFQENADIEVPLDSCDAIIRGEGEITLTDILKNGLNKNPGTFTPENGTWVFNGERPLIKKLDMFPWPRYEDVDWKDYPASELSIMGNRGCIYRCVFCNDIVRSDYKFRKRSAEHIAQEIIYHKEKSNIGFFIFNDPILNGDLHNLENLCDIFIKEKMDIPWAGNFSVRRNMPTRLMHKAREAGFVTAIVGLESGSRNVLSLMNKPFTVQEAEQFIGALHAAGINVELNLVVGFPGESEEDFQETLDLVSKISPFLSQIVSICTFNVDHSYLFDHIEEFDIIVDTNDAKRNINWRTKDGKNTYEIRCERANRLIELTRKLKLGYDRFDVDIEKRDKVTSMETVIKNRKFYKDIKNASPNNGVYIWGSGQGGIVTHKILSRLGVKVSGFIDNSEKKWNQSLFGLKIDGPKVILRNKGSNETPYVIIGSENDAEISAQLSQMGLKKNENFMKNPYLHVSN